MAHPSRVIGDAENAAAGGLRSIAPFSLHPADDVWGEMKREFGRGENAGETAADVAGLFAGTEVLGALNAGRTFEATRAARVAKYVDQGANPSLADYLADRYVGMGHHSGIARRFRIPDQVFGIPVTAALAGKKLPAWIVDSPLNVVSPPGMSRGDLYELHYGLDSHFYGAPVPADLNYGKGWSGKRLGLPRYGLPQRLWAGTPTSWKAFGGAIDVSQTPGIFQAGNQSPPQ